MCSTEKHNLFESHQLAESIFQIGNAWDAADFTLLSCCTNQIFQNGFFPKIVYRLLCVKERLLAIAVLIFRKLQP